MSDASAIVYIIDDDDISLMMLQELLQGIGAIFRAYHAAREFLDVYRPSPCECLVCDVRMPEIGGLQVQQELLAKGSELPIIFVSGYAEVPAAVEAMRRGAFDFLEKPVNGSTLLHKVQEALARSRALHAGRMRQVARNARLALLTPKERQIADLVVAGKSSPIIAGELNISVRTVENHRARLMEKLHVNSAVDLVKLLL